MKPYSKGAHFRKMGGILQRRKEELKSLVKEKTLQQNCHTLNLDAITKNVEKRKSQSSQEKNSQLSINNYPGDKDSMPRKNDELKLIENNNENTEKRNVVSNEKSKTQTSAAKEVFNF